jgi:hypothetical protein
VTGHAGRAVRDPARPCRQPKRPQPLAQPPFQDATAWTAFASRDELASAIDTFVLAYDEHDAKPYSWTYDGSPLKAA